MSLISDIQDDLNKGAVRLIAEYHARLLVDARKLCSDESDAEELVNRTFLKVINNISSHNEEADFYGWMKTIMTNLYRNDTKRLVLRRTDLVETEELEKIAGVDNGTIDQILQNSDHDVLREAIGRLDPEFRKLIAMRYFNEISVKDIAILLKTSPSSVSRKLALARQILAAKLADKLGKKKPLAVLFAVLLGAGALFGAYQVVETIFTAPAPTSTTTPTPTPTPISTPTAADPTAPVMTYPTFSSESATSIEPVSTKQEESTMTTMKKTLLAAVSAVSLASTANAVDVEAVKTRVMPAGITATTMADNNGFTYEYKKDGVKYGVAAFVADGTLDLSEIKALGVTSIDYLIVAGGGAGGSNENCGGGGAGGMLTSEGVSVEGVTALAIKVGAGGVSSDKLRTGANGDPSSIAFGEGEPIKAEGGGGGGALNCPANGGGSGGGGNGTGAGGGTLGDGGAGDPRQGCAGGRGVNASGTRYPGSGGGGAGSQGDNAVRGDIATACGGKGRKCDITGMEVYYAGGGGGGFYNSTSGARGGGDESGTNISGGSGAGNSADATSGLDGLGGGGGGSGSPYHKASGAGGSGIVVIRWVIPAVRSQVTVTYSGSGSGSVSGAGEYAEGETVTLVATADDGSHFARWEGAPAGATLDEKGTTLTFTMGMVPVAITAKFDEDLAKGVTILAEGGNYGTPDPAYEIYAEYADGTERTYTMAETVIGEGSEKIYLAGWKLLDGEGNLVRNSDTGLHDGESISLVKFTCGTSEAFTLVWRWETCYTLTTVANPAEGGTVSGAGDYAAGSEVTLTANVTGGYKLTGWTDAPEDATSVENTLTFAMPDAPTTVTANFEMVPWGITVVSGTTTNDNRNLCVQGADYQFQSPLYYIVQEGELRKRCIGYTLTPMREDGAESELFKVVPEGETLTATVTYAEPVRLTWQWADDYYFTLTKDGEGEVTGPAEGWYPSGTPFEITATPANNYEFLCWMGSVSGAETTISGTITKPTSVKALFSPVQQIKSEWEAVEQDSVVLPAMSRTVKSLGKTYCVVVFTNSTSGTYKLPKKVTSIDCLVVGGGGSGGGQRGGGGGAGGFLYQTGLAVTPGETLTVEIGAGGVDVDRWDGVGKPGKDTTLTIAGQTITAHAGGFGGYEGSKPGDGASGGGVGGNNSGSYAEANGGASTAVAPEQGNPGGDRTVTAKQKCGAGGGGAGSVGGDVDNGKGGDGLPSTITGEKVWYAAGGAGGGSSGACEGAANTGNGGGGAGTSGRSFAGGSGVVIIRYALPSAGVVFMIY